MSEFLPCSRPTLGEAELAAVGEVLRSRWITTGLKCAEREQAFCQLTGNRHAIAVSSVTGGMHVRLMALGLRLGDRGDYAFTDVGFTLNMICLRGAEPVMVDIDRDTLMVTPADIDAIHALGARYGSPVIEDAAHAAGTGYKGRHVGAAGTAIFSFHSIKNMTCAEGGMAVTDDDALAQRIRSLKFHGLAVDAFDRNMQGRAQQVEVMAPGYKYNLANINAAMARVRLDKLPQHNARRAALAPRYLRGLADTPFSPQALPAWEHRHTWHLFIIRIAERRCSINRDDLLMQALKERGIGTGLHFRAAHTQCYYRECFSDLLLLDTEWNAARICSLTLFPSMNDDDVERVIAALRAMAKV